jgi:acetyl-CoA/propionyl-CoA carboxylase, biotin carboxylase, biotin carboxyl carrier protein
VTADMSETLPLTGARDIRTVLVANRGEIACRIIDTLTTMGLRSVAVYSDADRLARHVELADAAYRIGPAPARQSYLNIEAIIAAALASGADAIHPGYGFLAENADFARACGEAGIVFIGPGVLALQTMGDKISAKKQVEAFGVPTIPGVAEPGLTDEQLIEAAQQVGYPLLIKPSAGGGGKGMELVAAPSELPTALQTARRVSRSAFGDDTLFLERFIDQPRHIEVQVLADAYGTTIYLGERECSLQRRHQKVIEEAPSPLLDDDTRRRIGEAACAVARSVDYVGAGTVEFLVSAAAPGEFFFMEMNTRLQVEHPVTELVTGIDLVEWQVQIAAGEALTIGQEQIRVSGHAVEARVYAESPEHDFLPSAGAVLALREPSGAGIRIDSSLVQSLTISSNYDPMLSKVIAWAPERSEALDRLAEALAATVILGVHTNLEYLRALIDRPEVRAGDLDTGLIERLLDQLEFRAADDRMLAVVALRLHSEREAVACGSLWQLPSGWRTGDARPAHYRLSPGSTDELIDVLVSGTPAARTVSIAGIAHHARLTQRDDAEASFDLEFDGVTSHVWIAGDGNAFWIGESGRSFLLEVHTRQRQLADALASVAPGASTTSPEIRTPMPGTVVAIDVTSGDQVAVNDVVVTVEAMKMEHKLRASRDGIVSVSVAVGDPVRLDQVVATVTPASVAAATSGAATTTDEPTQSASTTQRGRNNE